MLFAPCIVRDSIGIVGIRVSYTLSGELKVLNIDSNHRPLIPSRGMSAVSTPLSNLSSCFSPRYLALS
jgi:hypothetical protein